MSHEFKLKRRSAENEIHIPDGGWVVAHFAKVGTPSLAIRTHIWVTNLGCNKEACLKAVLVIKAKTSSRLSSPAMELIYSIW